MQVKVFQSENMASALKKVKETLGPDALILSTRTVRKGGGLFGKPLLEVTAAIEPEAAPVAAPRETTPRRRTSDAPQRSYATVADDLRYEDIWAGRKSTPVYEEPVQRRQPQANAASDTLRSEIDELRALVQGFVREMAEKKPAPQIAEPRWTPPAVPVRKGQDAWLAPVMAELTARGIDDEVAETIARFAGEKLTPQQVYSPGVLDSFFEDTLTDLVQVSGPILKRGSAQRRLALVGPTGVGKTTTIAKLAAEYLLNYGKKVVLVTIDTYRIAAVEQLKVYGEIMNVPVEVVMHPDQLEQVFARHQDKDLILIDTAGRSPKDEVSLQELAEFLHPDFETENHLVLSASTRERDLGEVIRRFKGLGLNSLIFTKLDECESLGTLVNVPVRHNFPISYLGNGQRVPEDLMLAEARKVAGLILGKQ